MDSAKITEQPETVQKMLKDVLEGYLKSQQELCEAIVELFKRTEGMENKKRKIE